MTKNYVVKNERLRDYLYLLGFDYREVEDRTLQQPYVYLFPNTDLLNEAITFYTQFKKRLQE